MWPGCLALFLALLGTCSAELLTPPYFNLAEGKEIIATATCGVESAGPELYCQLVGANSDQEGNLTSQNIIQGQQCDFCDPNDEDKRHPPEYAVDGMETWWQSPPLSRGKKYEQVNLTINLGQEFHVAYVYVRMGNSPRPGLWILEKSKDFGETWSPWQYFSDSDHDCTTYFGIDSHTPITRDDSVICTTEYSKIVPLEGGEIPISILNNRPSAKHYFNSTVLQEWTRATNVRFRFLKTKNLLGHLMSVRQQDPTVTRRYFYAIKDISIGGRCMCNGHADICDSLDPNHPKKLFCRCQHNTCGPQCTTCCKGFEQKKWRQSSHSKKFACEPCNCHGHSDECEYDPEIDEKHLSLDIYGNYEGGGRCKNCRHNTEGINCNKCKDTFYRPAGKHFNETDVCQPCNCNEPFHTGNCLDQTGQCECRTEYQAPNCDDCSYGYFGFPKCRPCECFINGTDGYQCEATEGQCPCKENYAGHYCNICAQEYYNFPECSACECNPIGSSNRVCDVVSGNCTCKNNYGGRRCDACEDGYYNYPSCTFCDCDERGTEPGVCDKENGRCLCKEGYGGPRCDQCVNGYFGYPNCEPCNCSTTGSTTTSCDAIGKCSCLSNFVGKTCNQCAPGFYNYPECTSCNCELHGSIGVSCDLEGKCQCRDNFDGDRCDRCKENFYNFPICEGCNCDPAGLDGTFQGCGSLPAGELCSCKERVEGRICNQCKKLYWNLQPNNPDGCEDCQCNIPGVIGGIAECDGKTGQCMCKPSVTGRDCTECADGSFNLQGSNLFGCTDCGCDIGGSLGPKCDKNEGQCACRVRVDGKRCDQTVKASYFPTLHQFQFEAEEGRTPGNRSVRYDFHEDLFPGYSWKGYAVFSSLQPKIIHEISVPKSSLYRMVMRYVNPNNESILGSVKITPDSHTEVEQNFKVLFKPQNSKPSFVTVSGAQGNLPSVMVMNPGHWTVTIAIEKNILLDYFVILPSEYYEATILTHQVSKPCEIGYQGLCRHYAYPKLESFDTSLGLGGKNQDGDSLSEFLTDQDLLETLDEARLPLINKAQPKIRFEPTISRTGPHMIVISYITPPTQNDTANVLVRVNGEDFGQVTFYPCKYTSVCRQVVTEPIRKVAVYNFPDNQATIELEGEPNNEVAIKNVVIIPAEEWAIDYITPKSVCVRKDGKCIQGVFPVAPEAKKIELELNNQIVDPSVTPDGIYDNSTKFVYLDGKEESTIDVPAKVASPGDYMFVIQYYQPEFPEFNVDVIIQNGKFYEAKVPMPHCPSNGGCRSLVRQSDGSPRFQLNDNFVITLKDDTGRGIWLDYILVIPADDYSDDYLKKLQFDQTNEFIQICGQNHFHIDTAEKGFCRDSVFSLTTNYNNGAFECRCDYSGSESFYCNEFGGQCQCKPNIIGRRCNICKTGFFGFPNCRPCNCPSTALCDAETGACICPPHVVGERCDQCEVGTYGYDPIIGCEECQCHPYGVVNGDTQCDLLTGHCKCKDNIVNRQCDKCLAGHYQFPYCDKCSCDVRGTLDEICDQETAECLCKDNVQGGACDSCKEGKFNLQPENEKGCSDCFCFGKTTRCTSSNLFKTHIMEMTGWDVAKINDNNSVEILKVKAQELNETNIFVDYESSEINEKDIIYLSAPVNYLNKKLTSYGGWLNYTVYYQTSGVSGRAVPAADIILQGVDTLLVHRVEEQPAESQNFFGSVQFIESNFETKPNLPATREQLMTVLGDLRGLYIRATYWQPTLTFSLSYVTLDTATETYNPQGEIASSVEQCQCPPAYKGLSCEECAKGYFRVPGPNGGYCVKCQCHGHADTCDVNTGICYDCKNGTTGEHCEECQVGYYGNATIGTPSDCMICACPLPIPSNNFAKGCDVSEDGSRISCECNPGYYGARCESCAAGYYGQPDLVGDTCKPCKCSGNIDTNEIGSCDSVSGECLKCLNNTYGQACNLCAPGFYGDAVERKDCRTCDCDKCGMKRCDNQNGICECHENVVGDHCDSCAENHYGFHTCQGCRPCNCGIASENLQCADEDGKCTCKPGVEGRTCDRCKVGYWNYGPDGCTSCECTTGYSRGTSCNPATGQCECLPGVLGEKCDHCPHRTVLDERRGCQTCDKCTHDLLDVTDELEQILDPVAKSFRTVSDSYFTNQRLDFINETINELLPEVKLLDPSRIDFRPLKEAVGNLSKKAYAMKSDVEFKEEHSGNVKQKAEDNLRNSYDLERTVAQKVGFVNAIVGDIQTLATNSDIEGGPKIENALRRAQELLAEMKQVSFVKDRDNATDIQDNANILYSEMITYETPVKDLMKDTDDVSDKVNALTNQIDDMLNLTVQVNDLANEAERVNFENKRLVDFNNINNLKSDVEKVNETITKAEDLNRKSKELADEADFNFGQLKTNVTPGTSTDANQKITDMIESNDVEYVEAQNDVAAAIDHARELNDKSLRLERDFAETRNLGGVRASSVYQDIANKLDDAKKFVDDATKAADNATKMSENFVNLSLNSELESENLLDEAGNVTRTQSDLKAMIRNARHVLDDLTYLNNNNNAKVEDIEYSLGNLHIQTSSSMIAQEALNNADKAEYMIEDVTLKILNPYSNSIHEDSKRSRQLANDSLASVRDMSQANHQLDLIDTTLPGIQNRLTAMGERQEANNNSGSNLYDRIEELKKKINHARELANRIRIGLSFAPNTVLELKNPESLPLQSTSTKLSVYVRTPRSNGFIMYLGNEKRPDAPRTKLSDYMALTVENGYPVLTLDLGSGPQRIIGSRSISDNRWRQLIVDRTGRNIKLIVREDAGDGKDTEFTTEQVLPGSHSIFNLDQEKSKLFVGGYPQSFLVPETIVPSSFEGEMEELMVGDVPVSFWNFVDGENNGNPAYERDMLINLTPNTGYRFDRDGYAILSKKSSGLPPDSKRFRVQFKFKTWNSNGLMYLMGGKKHYLALELRDGHILYQVDLGDKQAVIETPETYNDGNWHEVQAAREGSICVLRVDGERIGPDVDTGGENKNLATTDYVYFGGYPVSIPHNYKPVTQVGFEGCIDEVSFQETFVDLTKNAQAFGVATGCPVKFASLVSFDSVHPGFVKWEKVSVPNALQINLKFKTHSKNGLIYHLVDEDGTSASTLSLVNGQLVLESQGDRLETQTQDIKFNDDEWHVITTTHNGSSLRLDIDDVEEKSMDNAPYPKSIENGALYVGSVPDSMRRGARFEPFVGCVGDTTLNGVIVNFANSTERPYAHLGQCNHKSDQPGVDEGSVETQPPPVDNSWEDPNTNVIDLPNGREDSQGPTIVDQIPDNEQSPLPPSTEKQSTEAPTTTKEPETVDGCRLPANPADDPDAYKENASMFGTGDGSRFEYNSLKSRYKDEYDFQIEIRTLANEGIIFYASDMVNENKDLIAVYLQDGRVHYTYDCGSGPALIFSEGKVNDNQWTIIGFKRNGANGELIINNQTSVTGKSQGTTTTIGVQPPFYVGGVDPSISSIVLERIGTNKLFSGCIRNFMANQLPVGEPSLQEHIIPCSKRIEPGMFFYPGNGSNWFKAEDSFIVGKKIDIQMDIKPRSSSGLLFSIHGKKDYVVLEMLNGTIKFLVKASRGSIETAFEPQTPNSLCDGNWHKIRAIKQKNAVILSVDHKAAPPGIGHKNIGTVGTKHPTYIGGHPLIASAKSLKGSISNAQYAGCITNIIINEQPYALNPAQTHGKVLADVCPTI